MGPAINRTCPPNVIAPLTMIFKGVKKMQPIQGKVLEHTSLRNFLKIRVPADEWVVFTVSEWEPLTTSEQKKGDLVWVLLSEDRKRILNQLVSRNGYRVQIPRSLCGETCFYVDAYLHNPLYQEPVLTVWDASGTYIQGNCEPRITGSLWKEKSDSTDDVRRTHYFYFGELLHLELLTEGLNGCRKVDVELYCLTGDSPDTTRDILVTTLVAGIKGGRLKTAFASSFSWMQRLMIQNADLRNASSFQFYVRVKNKEKKDYIKDYGQRTYHACYVQLYNQVKNAGTFSLPRNLTATKIGEPAGNLKKYEHCKFSKIIAYEDGKITDIFNEEALVKMYTDKDRFETSRQVHYEFNSYQLSKESFAVLDELAKLLREMPFVPVEIGGHTDSRGSDAYNQVLSERRAKSVMDYLIDQGIHPGRIRARGYGKREPLYREEQMPGGACEEKMLTEQEKKLREPLHHENRRTTIRFLVNGNNAQTLVMEIMAPSHEHPKEYRIKTVEEKHSRCLKAQDRHTLEKKVVEFSQFHAGKVTLKEGVEISYPVHSVVSPGIKEHYLSYLLQYLAPGKEPVNRYFFHMHSCAYYSSKNQPTVLLKVFPDLVWIGHFQYNFYEINEKEEKAAKKDYFFHNHRVVLQNGMDTLVNAVSKKISTLVFRLIPPSWISENVIVRYLREQASDYDYGLHLIHNRKIENPGDRLSLQGTPTDLLTETRYPKYAAAYGVYLLVLTQILIELLLIYLTRGRNLKGKVARLARRYKRFKKFMDDNNLSLIAPSIALNGGMYYYMDRHRKMGLMYELNIKAEPLVEIHFRQEFDLLNDFLNSGGKEGNAQVAALLKKAGFTTVKGNFDADGILAFEDSLRYHLLTNKYSAGERMLHLFTLGHNERLVDGKIDLQVKLNFEYKNEFEFFGVTTNIEGKVDFDFNGGAGLKLRYGTSPQKGLFMELILIFSGVKGIFSGNIKNESDWGLLDFDYSPNKGEPIPFTLLEAKEFSLCKIYLFDPNP